MAEPSKEAMELARHLWGNRPGLVDVAAAIDTIYARGRADGAREMRERCAKMIAWSFGASSAVAAIRALPLPDAAPEGSAKP